MRTVNTTVAKAYLSRLVDEVAAGEEMVIAQAGKPLARLVRFASGRDSRSRRQPGTAGLMKGRIWIADEFDHPLPDWTTAPGARR